MHSYVESFHLQGFSNGSNARRVSKLCGVTETDAFVSNVLHYDKVNALDEKVGVFLSYYKDRTKIQTIVVKAYYRLKKMR